MLDEPAAPEFDVWLDELLALFWLPAFELLELLELLALSALFWLLESFDLFG